MDIEFLFYNNKSKHIYNYTNTGVLLNGLSVMPCYIIKFLKHIKNKINISLYFLFYSKLI